MLAICRSESGAATLPAGVAALGGSGAGVDCFPDLVPGVPVVQQHIDKLVLGGAELLDGDCHLVEDVDGVCRGPRFGHGVKGAGELVGEAAKLVSRYWYLRVHLMSLGVRWLSGRKANG